MVPGQPHLLEFALYPTGHIFAKGRRIRITITGADKDNRLTPRQKPNPTITLYRGGANGSVLRLPVAPKKSTEE